MFGSLERAILSMDGAIQAPGLRYAAMMAGAGALSAMLAALVAAGLGGSSQTALVAAGCVGAGALVSVLPGVLRLRSGVQYWGMLVLAASMTRLLLTMGIGLGLQEADGVSTRPLWIGIAVGVFAHLVAETGYSVAILSGLERAKAAGSRAAPETERRTA